MMALFLIFTATTVKSSNVEEEIVESSQLNKEENATQSTTGVVGESRTTGPIIETEEDDDFEDYDPDDFAILGNEWLLKEIKEIEEQIQTATTSGSEDVEDVGEVSSTSSGKPSTTTA